MDKDARTDDIDRHHDRRDRRRDDDKHQDISGVLSSLRREELMIVEAHHTHPERCRQADEDRIDEEEVEGSEEEVQLARSQSIARRTERRHERRSDGDPRDHIPSTTTSREGDDTSGTTEEGDEYVIDRRRSTRQQLGLRLLQRTDEKVNRSSEDADERSDTEVLQRALQQVKVIRPHSEPHPDDRSHERGDEHRTDDDSSRIDIETERSDEDRCDEDPEISSTVGHPTSHLLDDRLLLFEVRT